MMFSALPPAFLLLLECFLASAAPASASNQLASTPGALLRGNASITYVSKYWPEQSSCCTGYFTTSPVTLKPEFRPAASTSDGPTGPYNYTVKDTLTSLHMYVFRTLPLDPCALYPLFANAQEVVAQHSNDGGGHSYADHWLVQQDDPLVLSYPNPSAGNAWFWAQSAIDKQGRQQHLTYRIVHNSMWGLRDFSTSGDAHYGLSFEVVEGRWGSVGTGLVMPGELPAGGTVNASYPGQLESMRVLNMAAVTEALEQG